jgi:hypothetical protein
MVPQPLWGRNLRAVLSAASWNRVRREAYAATGSRCRICGGRGRRHAVEADEFWVYDDKRGVQTLRDVVALCPSCHGVRHWGKTVAVDGREAAAYATLMTVNGWSREQAEAAVVAAWERWHRRSERNWVTDYSWVTRRYGIAIDAAGLARAEAANRALIAQAMAAARLAVR